MAPDAFRLYRTTAMRERIEIDLSGYRLPPVLAYGFLRISGARSLPVSELVIGGITDEHVSLTLFGKSSGADDFSLLSIQMYRLPQGRAEFDADVEFFGDRRKKAASLPEGVRFEQAVLVPKGIPSNWVHDAFARGGNDVIHTYHSPRHAMLIRYRGKRMLDNVLFRGVNQRLVVVEGQWELSSPRCAPRPGLEPGATEKPLTKSVADEVSAAIERAYEYLHLPATRTTPQAARKAICDAVDRLIASRKRLPGGKTDALAIELGCLWGQSLCDSLGWQWRQLKYGRGATIYAVVSPDRSYAVAPMQYMLRQIRQRGARADNTTLLLFNMLKENAVPQVRPRAYRLLS